MSNFPTVRLRRTRQNEKLRGMVRETNLNVDQLIYPLFVTETSIVKQYKKRYFLISAWIS